MKMLENKVALVTGAGSGIGKAIALLYAAQGAKVIVSDINEKSGKEVTEEIISKEGTAVFFNADTSNPKDQENLVKEAMKQFGALHIACNNAGIGGDLLPTADYPIESWNKIIGINLSGVFYGMHFQIPAMLASGGGSIVNISSILGQVGTKGLSGYVSAKHGVVGLTKTAGIEYAEQNIRVNAVGPGYIETPLLTDTLDEKTIAALAGLHPMNRLGNADEVAELVLWLSCSKASFVTGSYYAVDGGYLAQ
ncbi:MAG: glucose 1-dehydrogenase [Bacteroidetes bacterium]|nr:glucose 1-dehydrogenase [Bacteroidota bacterium]